MTQQIPEGWERCKIGDADKVFLENMRSSFSFTIVNENYIHVNASQIRLADFNFFGITPIRKIKPIEFTADGNSPIGGIFLIGGTPYMRVDFNFAGKKFREVIE